MDGDDDDSIDEVTIGIAGCDIADEAAPGRCVYPETLLQCIEDDEEKLLAGKTFCKSPLMTQSSIAELEAETLQKNHIFPKSDSVASGLSTNSVTTIEEEQEQPSCSATDTTKGNLSPSIERQSSELSWSSRLRQSRKHVFVLSTAGKPIFSRHGNEEDHSTLTGVMQALVSFVDSQSSGDELNYIITGSWKFFFLHRSPLILVAASCSSESVLQLRHQLILVYHQILSVLTFSHLTKIFDQRKNFDLRRLLTGTERTFESLITMTEQDPSHLLNAVRCHYLSSAVRDSVGQAIVHYISKSKNVVFAILIANNQLVTMSRMKKYSLFPSDLVLIINLVAANPSFKNVESWSPVCLPRFDNTGFLHAHISYLTDDCNACLLLLTVDKTAFFSLSEIKQKIVERLAKNKILLPLKDACGLNKGVKLSELLINDLWHFLYKNRTTSQYTCPDFERPYVDIESQQRLFSRYLKIHNYMHAPTKQLEMPAPMKQLEMHPPTKQLKIFYVTGDKESILGWITLNFELYAVFSPLTTKSAAIGKVDKLMRCLKKEEEQLFILNPPLF